MTTLKSLHDALENALALEDLITKCRESISQYPGMSEPVWADESQIDKIISSCRLELARNRKQIASDQLHHVEYPISRMATKSGVHQITKDLLTAIRDRDKDKYALCANTILDLEEQRKRLQKLGEDISKLRRLFPQFTQSLEQTCNDSYWEERIQCIREGILYETEGENQVLNSIIPARTVPIQPKSAVPLSIDWNAVLIVEALFSNATGIKAFALAS